MRLILALICTALPSIALALMPPHWNSINPSAGSTLNTRILVMHGYTLQSAELKITDGDGKAVAFDKSADCSWEGKGDMPGAQQHRCTLTITLTGDPKPGSALTVELYGRSAKYTVGKLPPKGSETAPTGLDNLAPKPPAPPAPSSK